MNHHWALIGARGANAAGVVSVNRGGLFATASARRNFATVLEIESFRKLEIQLNRRTLVLALQSVADGNVDLWPVESAIARINGPRMLEFVKGVSKPLLRHVPDGNLSKKLFGSR